MSGQDHIEASLREAAPDLLAYFERRVAPREDAADLLGELMLQAWRNARSAPAEEEQRRMWLYGVARNVLANHTRSVRRRTALVDRLRRHLSVDRPGALGQADYRPGCRGAGPQRLDRAGALLGRPGGAAGRGR
jgi:DNA-directed RNA polymerase specialized sigma24 family protein